MPNIDDIKLMAAKLTYPKNQEYDPETLAPLGVTCNRVTHLEENVPQLLEGGDSLLDLGSSKGFISFFLRDRFMKIVGYERSSDAYRIAEAVRQYHCLERISFCNKPFREIPFDRSWPTTYSTVYVGSVHHHLIKDAILHNAPMFLPLKRLMALADNYLILDGPFTFEHDYSLGAWEKEYGWGPEIRESYTFGGHVKALLPQFRLVQGPIANERGRDTAVFQRVQVNVPQQETSPADIQTLRSQATPVEANPAGPDYRVLRQGGMRYKFDRGLQPDGIFLILNSLPDYFARTMAVLTQSGVCVGDIAEWVDGPCMEVNREFWLHWLRLNDILSCVGLIEPHFKPTDFKIRNGTPVDVDVDMVQSIARISLNTSYLAAWEESKKQCLGREYHEALEHIVNHISNEFVFHNVLERFESCL